MTDKVLVNERLIEAEPRNPMQRFLDKQAKGENPGPSLAIKAKCWDCMKGPYGKSDEDTKDAIRDCIWGPNKTFQCPLWEFRPYRGKQ